MIPNLTTYSFCNFVQLQITKRLTAARLALVLQIQAAALAASYVSENDWNNFILATEDYYKTWTENIAFNPNAVLDADTIAFASILTTPLTATRLELINDLVVQLKADGNWTKLDRLWIHTTEAQDQAVVSLVNPSSTKITEHNSPTWAPNVGYTGNGTNMYLDTNYNPNTDGINYILNDAMLGSYIRSNQLSDNAAVIGVTDASSYRSAIYPRYTTNTFFSQLNTAAANLISYSNNNSLGFFSVTRTASNLQTGYINGISKATNSGASTTVANYKINILSNSYAGTAAEFTLRTIGLSLIGAGTINQLKLYNAIQTFMTAIGANV